MKLFKKMITFVLVALMTAAMGATNVAAEDPKSGSITVTTNFKDQTYTLYKLFDAQISFDDQGKQKAITYTLPEGKSLTGNAWYTVNANGFIEKTNALTDEVMKSAAYREWARGFGTTVGDPIKAKANNDPNVKWERLDWGYYFVDSTLGAFITVDTDNPDVEVKDKNSIPSVDKEITGVGESKDTSSLGVGDNATDPGEGKNEKAIAQVGDPVSYKLTVVIKPGAENYVVTDTLSNGLTAPAVSDVAVSAGAGNYEVGVEGQVITVTFKKTYLDTITADTPVTIEYSAVLNNSAVIGEAGNPNTVRLTWGHAPGENPNYSQDDAKVYTAQVEVLKQDQDAKPLKDAGFVVKNSENQYYKLATVEGKQVVTWVASIDDAEEHMSGADGKVPPFTGLKNGSYTLVEKTVPAGYNKLADSTFTIADKDYTNTNLKKTNTVENQKGTELPSTGGIGTTIFYVLGGLMVVGAGIVLVARRKASE